MKYQTLFIITAKLCSTVWLFFAAVLATKWSLSGGTRKGLAWLLLVKLYVFSRSGLRFWELSRDHSFVLLSVLLDLIPAIESPKVM